MGRGAIIERLLFLLLIKTNGIVFPTRSMVIMSGRFPHPGRAVNDSAKESGKENEVQG